MWGFQDLPCRFSIFLLPYSSYKGLYCVWRKPCAMQKPNQSLISGAQVLFGGSLLVLWGFRSSHVEVWQVSRLRMAWNCKCPTSIQEEVMLEHGYEQFRRGLELVLDVCRCIRCPSWDALLVCMGEWGSECKYSYGVLFRSYMDEPLSPTLSYARVRSLPRRTNTSHHAENYVETAVCLFGSACFPFGSKVLNSPVLSSPTFTWWYGMSGLLCPVASASVPRCISSSKFMWLSNKERLDGPAELRKKKCMACLIEAGS